MEEEEACIEEEVLVQEDLVLQEEGEVTSAAQFISRVMN